MRIKIEILSILIILVFSSCFKEEQMIKLPATQTDVQLKQIELTETYKYQVFYDLKTNTAIKTNITSDWDLGFLSSDTAWHIILNNSKVMFAGNSYKTVFEQVTKPTGIKMNFDNSGGKSDSLALRGWADLSSGLPVSFKYVYVIDLGYDGNLNKLGYKKIIIETPINNTYKIRYANLNGTEEQTVTIEKNPTVNYVCFSFENGIVDIEPPKTDWSLLFTRYETMLITSYGNSVPYTVVGVLLNPHNVKANIDTSLVFKDIELKDTLNYIFKKQSDIIGYAWKDYIYATNVYIIVPNRNYLIHSNDNYYYKLRFVDFYNNLNQKGYPRFEFSRL